MWAAMTVLLPIARKWRERSCRHSIRPSRVSGGRSPNRGQHRCLHDLVYAMQRELGDVCGTEQSRQSQELPSPPSELQFSQSSTTWLSVRQEHALPHMCATPRIRKPTAPSNRLRLVRSLRPASFPRPGSSLSFGSAVPSVPLDRNPSFILSPFARLLPRRR